MTSPPQFTVWRGLSAWLREGVPRGGLWRSLRALCSELAYFVRDSTPSRRRARYGDIEFDWDFGVDTTSANLGIRSRLRGAVSGAPYQPSDPALFHQIMGWLPIDFREYVFIDLGSGKGRALLMAADYPFRRIIGVELLPELHRVAQTNISQYQSDSQKCFAIETQVGDAREFVFPPEPAVIYLFNPLAEAGLEKVVRNLEASLRQHARPVWVAYHNPINEHLLSGRALLHRVSGTHQVALYASVP